jgi:hypothetical protein
LNHRSKCNTRQQSSGQVFDRSKRELNETARDAR